MYIIRTVSEMCCSPGFALLTCARPSQLLPSPRRHARTREHARHSFRLLFLNAFCFRIDDGSPVRRCRCFRTRSTHLACSLHALKSIAVHPAVWRIADARQATALPAPANQGCSCYVRAESIFSRSLLVPPHTMADRLAARLFQHSGLSFRSGCLRCRAENASIHPARNIALFIGAPPLEPPLSLTTQIRPRLLFSPPARPQHGYLTDIITAARYARDWVAGPSRPVRSSAGRARSPPCTHLRASSSRPCAPPGARAGSTPGRA